MGDNVARRPATDAIVPPSETSGSDISGARLTPFPSEAAPASATHPVEGDWTSLATAPTLLLTPTDGAGAADALKTSPIAALPLVPPDGPPWFRTGATVRPPSMRPIAESVAPLPARQPPNPRVLKVVFGVIAGCLFIVAAAGLKLIYKRFQTPATPAASEVAAPPPIAATDLAKPSPAPDTTADEHPPAIPASATRAPAEATRRAAPVQKSPVRTTTKATTRRTAPPKKTVRGTH
jgi:hypothetical protein